MLFVWFYDRYFFLTDGDRLLEKILYYLPLQDQDEQLMLDKFKSVTRATLKGMVVIGILLAIGGSYGKAVGLALFCAVVVGSVDNLLRPVLVGKDTQMHELMIFFGTLGGIFMFGLVGINLHKTLICR